MQDTSVNLGSSEDSASGTDEPILSPAEDLTKIRSDFRSRLLAANLRTEAVRAGMIDLDGLKLIDTSTIRLGDDDEVIEGRRIMEDLRRNKPWLFTTGSSSSPARAPASQPVRQKTALEMSEEEYAAARLAVTKYHF